jgi:tetratricopeptide (TPR) repeat protein
LDRLPEAEDAYREALTIHQQLASDYPTIVEHQNEVAGAMVNVARVLMMRKDFRGARELLQQALPYHQVALRASPNHPAYRNFYRINRWRLAETLLELQEHATAADAAEQFLQAATELPRDAYTAARLFATCARLAENDERLDVGERQALMTAYRDRALDALHRAIDTGFKDVAQLKSDASLDALRSQQGFQSLLTQLESQRNE